MIVGIKIFIVPQLTPTAFRQASLTS